MKFLYRILLFGICLGLLAASLSCRIRTDTAASARDKDPKSDPNLVFFAGWRFPEKGIILAKVKASTSEDSYFSLDSPGGEPRIYDVPNIDLKINDGIINQQATSHSGKQKVTATRQEDNFGKLLNAEVTLIHNAEPEKTTKLAEGKDAVWKVHGWSDNDRFIVFSSNGKIFLINAATKEKIDVKMPKVESASQVAINENGSGFYAVGNAFSAGFDLDYFDFTTQKAANILSVKRETRKPTDFEGYLSPDKKLMAVVVSSHNAANAMHFDAENSFCLYDLQTGQLLKTYELPKGYIKLENKIYFSGPRWRSDNQEIAFSFRPTEGKEEYSTINIRDGKITQWFSSGK